MESVDPREDIRALQRPDSADVGEETAAGGYYTAPGSLADDDDVAVLEDVAETPVRPLRPPGLTFASPVVQPPPAVLHEPVRSTRPNLTASAGTSLRLDDVFSQPRHVRPACDFVPLPKYKPGIKTVHIGKLNISSMPQYSGEAHKLLPWLTDIHQHMSAFYLSTEYWVNAATLTMNGHARVWVKQQATDPFDDWDDFVWRVQVRFISPGLHSDTMRLLQTTRQLPNQSVDDFTAVFISRLQIIGYQYAEVYIQWYMDNLRSDIVDRMELAVGEYPPLQEAVARARAAEAKLRRTQHARRIEERARLARLHANGGGRGHGGGRGNGGGGRGNGGGGGGRASGGGTYAGAVAQQQQHADLRVASTDSQQQQQRQPRGAKPQGAKTQGAKPAVDIATLDFCFPPQAERETLRAAGKCYRCHQPGHQFTSCTATRPVRPWSGGAKSA